MNIVEALTDPELLGIWFEGDSWANWRTIIRAAQGEPLTLDELAFFQSVSGGRIPPTRPVKELWVLAGRRAGKDAVASALVSLIAAGFDPADLRPGERAVCALLAVDRNQSKIVRNYVKGYFAEVPALQSLVVRENDNGLELSNSVDIEITTSDYRSVRGRTYLCVVLDEIALWRGEDSTVNPDTEIYSALRPGMATLKESLLIGISSVYRRSGLAYERWSRYFGKDSDRYLIILAPSAVLNPTLDLSEIEAAMADDPASARADYLSIWRDDLSTFVPRDLIENAVDKGVTVRPYDKRFRYVAFDDPAGGVSARGDSYAAAVAHRENDIVVLDWAAEFKPPFNTSVVVATISQMLMSYRISEIQGDNVSAGFAIQEFARNGIRRLESSPISRSDLYLDLLARLGSGRVRLVDNPRMVNQFASLERRAQPGGHDKVNHPQNQHDDIANAAAGALWRATQKSRSLDWVTPEILEKARQPYRPSLAGRRPSSIESRVLANRRELIRRGLSQDQIDACLGRIPELTS